MDGDRGKMKLIIEWEARNIMLKGCSQTVIKKIADYKKNQDEPKVIILDRINLDLPQNAMSAMKWIVKVQAKIRAWLIRRHLRNVEW